jgi:hypothetical protein
VRWRTAKIPTTELLAERLTYLAEAITELNPLAPTTADELERLGNQTGPPFRLCWGGPFYG